MSWWSKAKKKAKKAVKKTVTGIVTVAAAVTGFFGGFQSHPSAPNFHIEQTACGSRVVFEPGIPDYFLIPQEDGTYRAIPSNAIPSNAIPANMRRATAAIPSNALPSSALPSSALPSSAIPSNFWDHAIPANAIPSNALPSSAIPSNAIPSNALDFADSLKRVQGYVTDLSQALPSSATYQAWQMQPNQQFSETAVGVNYAQVQSNIPGLKFQRSLTCQTQIIPSLGQKTCLLCTGYKLMATTDSFNSSTSGGGSGSSAGQFNSTPIGVETVSASSCGGEGKIRYYDGGENGANHLVFVEAQNGFDPGNYKLNFAGRSFQCEDVTAARLVCYGQPPAMETNSPSVMLQKGSCDYPAGQVFVTSQETASSDQSEKRDDKPQNEQVTGVEVGGDASCSDDSDCGLSEQCICGSCQAYGPVSSDPSQEIGVETVVICGP